MKESFVIWIVPLLIKLIYIFLVNSIRWTIVGKPVDPDDPKRNLYAFWHARILMLPRVFIGWNGFVMISEHRDGGFISDAIQLMGLEAIRGSTTRGGARAMLKMLRAVKHENKSLAITPDGPKGPREILQKGTIQLAMKSKLPVIPVCYATKRHWRVNSWDRFYIPKPFTRGVYVFGDPILISEGDDMDEALQDVQQAMDETQQKADSYFD